MTAPHPTSGRWRSGARGAWGLALLTAPERLASRLGRPPSQAIRAVIRVLGARELLQASVSSLCPGRRVLLASAAVDATHSGSMVFLATRSAGLRRLAGASAVVSALFGAATVREALRAPPDPVPGRLRKR